MNGTGQLSMDLDEQHELTGLGFLQRTRFSRRAMISFRHQRNVTWIIKLLLVPQTGMGGRKKLQ